MVLRARWQARNIGVVRREGRGARRTGARQWRDLAGCAVAGRWLRGDEVTPRQRRLPEE